MKQKVLISGASGFVGFHLIEAALKCDLEVYAAIRKSSNVKHLENLPISYTFPDFTNAEKLSDDIKANGYDYIIHAAGTTKAKDTDEYNRINATYTQNLALAVEKAGAQIKKLVFVSSLAAVGPLSETNDRIVESTPQQPVTAYGKSKLVAESYLKGMKLPLIVLRPTAVYGPRDKDIFIILKTFFRGLEPYIGKKAQQLSFVYVKDLAKVAIQALFTGEQANGTYNITDGNCYNRYELATISKKALGRNTFKFHIPVSVVRILAIILEKAYGFTNKTPALNLEKLNELTAANWCCDIDKAKQQLAFEPAFDLKKGLQETLEWYKQNQWF